MEVEQSRSDDDIAIYIDELKCDDPNLKLNAVTKIVDIAKILGIYQNDTGPVRTREELIPYLTEIIEECDNDDDFLTKLAENLVLLKGRIILSRSGRRLAVRLHFAQSSRVHIIYRRAQHKRNCYSKCEETSRESIY